MPTSVMSTLHYRLDMTLVSFPDDSAIMPLSNMHISDTQ